jgi:TRAP-type C4-dicarboxylate transport system substrate-binding protein
MNKIQVKWVIAHEPIGYFLAVAQNFAKEVNDKTYGMFDIEVLSLAEFSEKYYDEKKITKYDLMDLINSGKIEMSHIYTTWLGDYNKDLHALDLPFLFQDHDHADRILDGEIGAELLAGVAKNSNVQPLSYTYSGGFRVVPSNFRAEKVEDWKGRKVRTSRSPVAVDVFKLLGAEPKEHIPLETMNEYADRGEIEAGESTYVRIFPLDQYKSFKYVNDTEHSLFLTSIIINQDFMKSLDPQFQSILSQAAFNAAKIERKTSVEDIPNILAECNEKGVEVIRMNDTETAKFKELTSKVYSMYEDYFTVGLVDRLKSA